MPDRYYLPYAPSIKEELTKMFSDIEFGSSFALPHSQHLSIDIPDSAAPAYGEILAAGVAVKRRAAEPEGHILMKTENRVFYLKTLPAQGGRRSIAVDISPIPSGKPAEELEARARTAITRCEQQAAYMRAKAAGESPEPWSAGG